jgi:hypothetical protein
MDGDVVRYRATNFMTRRVPTPIGEPDGRTTPRLERIVRAFRTAGINAKAESQMDAWLKTHAAFEVPLRQAVHAAGGPVALADDPDAVRGMIRLMRQNLAAMPTSPCLADSLRCRGWWFEADAWRDPQAQREFLARIDTYRDEGPPPAEQRMSREEIRTQFGV